MAKRYRVTWDILIDDKSPVAAAIEAAMAIRSKDSPPLGFTVQELCDDGSESILSPREIDLSEYYHCPKCCEYFSDTKIEDCDPEEAETMPLTLGVFCPKCNSELKGCVDTL